MKFSGKTWLMINIKSQKKSKFTISLENKLLEKPQGGVKLIPSPAFFRLKISYKL